MAAHAPSACQTTAVYGDITLTSAFDSGNAVRFEKVGRRPSAYGASCSVGRVARLRCPPPPPRASPQVDSCNYSVWIGKDCQDTEFETHYSTWFHFRISGHRQGAMLAFTVKNMNRQSALYNNGFKPVTKCEPSKPAWGPVSGGVEFLVRINWELKRMGSVFAALALLHAFCC